MAGARARPRQHRAAADVPPRKCMLLLLDRHLSPRAYTMQDVEMYTPFCSNTHFSVHAIHWLFVRNTRLWHSHSTTSLDPLIIDYEKSCAPNNSTAEEFAGTKAHIVPSALIRRRWFPPRLKNFEAPGGMQPMCNCLSIFKDIKIPDSLHINQQ